MLGGWSRARRRAARARLRVRRLGAAGRRREREGRALRRRQRRRGARAGTRSTPARSRAGSAAPTCPSRSASSSRSSTRTTCSATRPRTWAAATRTTSSATSACMLPPTVDEDLRGKPIGPRADADGDDRLHGAARGPPRASSTTSTSTPTCTGSSTTKIGRILDALGDAERPRLAALADGRSSAAADHGEMGLSHGGLRQKAFNAYEETIHVPLVVSNPVLFPKPAETDALASLVDVLPTIARPRRRPRADGDAGLQGRDLTPILAANAARERERLRALPRSTSAGARAPRAGRDRPGRDPLHLRRPPGRDGAAEAPGQPNRIRAIRTRTAQVRASTSTRRASARASTRCTTSSGIRTRSGTWSGSRTGATLDPADRQVHSELVEALGNAMKKAGTEPATATEVKSP